MIVPQVGHFYQTQKYVTRGVYGMWSQLSSAQHCRSYCYIHKITKDNMIVDMYHVNLDMKRVVQTNIEKTILHDAFHLFYKFDTETSFEAFKILYML